jgi:hypothetical protein
MEVLVTIRTFAGDQRHFSKPFGTLETARRIGNLSMAIAYCRAMGLPHKKLDTLLGVELDRHPDLRDFMVRFGELVESEFNNNVVAGNFADETGEAYVSWCLKSMGLRLFEVLDEV